MDNPFSWDYLSTVPGENEVFGAFAIGFLILFGIGFIVSFVAYAGWADRWVKSGVIRFLSRKYAGWALSLFAIGLFFFLIRILQINPFTFGRRIWLYLCLLALAGFVALLVAEFVKNAPVINKQIEDRKRMNQVLTSAKGTKITGPGAPLAVGARPVKRKRR
jgi:hypothetical protein